MGKAMSACQECQVTPVRTKHVETNATYDNGISLARSAQSQRCGRGKACGLTGTGLVDKLLGNPFELGLRDPPICLDRLPLPSSHFLVHMPQVGEGREMVSEDQGVLLYRKIKDPAFAGGGLLGKHVEDRSPFRVLQVEGVQHRIGDMQQLLSA